MHWNANMHSAKRIGCATMCCADKSCEKNKEIIVLLYLRTNTHACVKERGRVVAQRDS